MTRETLHFDLTVVGGGLAGVCAAISAARGGQRVALVQNRPVLGGNSSSEVRVWVSSATAHGTQRYARECGIVGELFLDNEFTNPEGNPYLWDLVVLQAVRREANIALFLNTDVREVTMRDAQTVESVHGWQMGSERHLEFRSPLFADCSGDGLVGFLAGADHTVGRESRATYGEAWAPETADAITLGSTILFYTKDAGRPVPFVPPSFAVRLEDTAIPERRVIRSGDNGCAYWWIEWGGELDTIGDNERIRDELWGVIYGIWDYIKNSGRFPDAASMTLEWVGSVPGKRESRRFLGDHVLTQQDILEQREFDDPVAFGGWSIDLHPPQGVYSAERGSQHLFSDGVYAIPYRSLYSRNIANLLFAGRNISASHVAFGSTRVMATCAAMGEAAGTAASLCLQHGVSPRSLYTDHRTALVQRLLRADASVLGVRNSDPDDLAGRARVTASSSAGNVALEPGEAAHALVEDLGVLVPLSGGLDRVRLCVDVAQPTTLRYALYSTSRPQNAVPDAALLEGAVALGAGDGQWAALETVLATCGARNVFLVVRANPCVAVRLGVEPLVGVLGFVRRAALTTGDGNEGHNAQPLREWNPKPLHRTPPALCLEPAQTVYAPASATNGYARPYGGPNAWVSAPLAAGDEAWLELRWPAPVRVSEVLVTWNDDPNEDLINLHHHRSPWRVIPELARDYRVEVCTSRGWQLVERVVDNRRRRCAHRFETLETNAVRVVVEATNGAARASVFELRAYA
jgi:hypothetical protein